MPLWPQPGLIPRDNARGCSVKTIGYFGREINYYSRIFHKPSGFFKVRDAVLRVANTLGLLLIERGPNNWNDFHDIDIVIGIRSFDTNNYDTKPPSKLINSWLAGIPFIGGYDSAFCQIGSPGKDFIRVTNEKELLYNLDLLSRDPIYYDNFVSRGKLMSEKFTRQSIIDRWVEVVDMLAKDFLKN